MSEKKNIFCGIWFRLLVSFLGAVILSSYFEKEQVRFFMPLRNMLYVPEISVGMSSDVKSPDGMPLKVSKDGYYVNPHHAASVVFETSKRVIGLGCNSISDEERKKILDFAVYFSSISKLRSYLGVDFAVWEYPISFSSCLKPGWISGMAQARVAVVLAAASICSVGNDTKIFRELSFQAISSLEVPVKHGGVFLEVPGGYWYEEYAQPGCASSFVLNGHIYVLLALDILRDFDERAEILMEKGLNALEENIQFYDGITWSYYNLSGTPANNIYQQSLHARQMKQLYEITQNDLFLKYHKKFYMQKLSPFSSLQRLLLRPSRFLFFILVVDTFVLFGVFAFVSYLGKRYDLSGIKRNNPKS